MLLPTDALAACLKVHEGQTRKDGKTPFAVHPIRVALKVASFGLGTWAPACLLHDGPEDQPTRITFEVIERDFGSNTATVVRQLTKMPGQQKRQYIASFASAHWPACIIKMADRLDNLQDWGGMDPEYKPAYAEEAERLLKAIQANQAFMFHTGGNFNDRFIAAAYKSLKEDLEKEIAAARGWKVEPVPTRQYIGTPAKGMKVQWNGQTETYSSGGPEGLEMGKTYTIKDFRIHDWSTTVWLEELPHGYGSVLFKSAEA